MTFWLRLVPAELSLEKGTKGSEHNAGFCWKTHENRQNTLIFDSASACHKGFFSGISMLRLTPLTALYPRRAAPPCRAGIGLFSADNAVGRASAQR